MVRVKICGVTHPNDAKLVWQAGADAIGFVMVPASKRYISPQDCQSIIEGLPPFITTVALFMNATADEVHAALEQCHIDVIQFHGDETAEYCRQFNKPYMKAVSANDTQQLSRLGDYHDAYALLLDSHAVGELGGTGQSFDWSLIPNHLNNIIVAGGINPDNAYEACMLDNIVGVDLSSGVESQLGIKSADKITHLMHEVLRARHDKNSSL